MPSPRDLLGYMTTVGRGSPVDRPWSVAGQILTVARKGNAAPGSPLTRRARLRLIHLTAAKASLATPFPLRR